MLGGRLVDRGDALLGGLVRDERRRGSVSAARADDVRVRLRPVEEAARRLEPLCRVWVVVLQRLRLARHPVERAPRARPRPPDDVAGAAEDRAGGGAAHEQRAADEEGAADDRRAGVADETGERPAEREPEEASAVAAEQRHEPEEPDAEPEPERADVEEVAAREHEPADADQRERQHVRGAAEDRLEHVREPRAHRAAVEAEVEDRGEDETERGQPQAEQLALVVRPRAALGGPPLHPRRDARTKRPPLPPPARHEPRFDAARGRSCRAQPVARARASATTRSASARFP